MAKTTLVEPGQDPMKVWRAGRGGIGSRGGGLLGGFQLDGAFIFYAACALCFGYYLWWQFGPKPAPVQAAPPIATGIGEVAETLVPTATLTPTATATPTPSATGLLPTAVIPGFFTTRLPAAQPTATASPTPVIILPGGTITPSATPSPAVVYIQVPVTKVVRQVVYQTQVVVQTVEVPVVTVVATTYIVERVITATPGPTQTPWIVTATPQAAAVYRFYIPMAIGGD